MNNKTIGPLLGCAILILAGAVALGQGGRDPGAGPRGGRGPGRGSRGGPGSGFDLSGGGNFSGEGAGSMRTLLETSDAEWKLIGPMLERVAIAREAVDSAALAGTLEAVSEGGRRGGGPPGPGANSVPGADGSVDLRAQREDVAMVDQALADLRKALADSRTSQDELKQLTQRYHAARDRAQKDLESAERELMDVLTSRQEAVLLGLGYLD